MRAFHFPLQAVLTVRENQEHKALEALGHAQAQLHRLLLQQTAARKAIEDAFDQHRQAQGRHANSEDFQHLQQGLRVLQRRLRDCDAEVEKSRKEVAARSRHLMEARQHREVIERVFEKQLARHHLETSRAEQKALDELSALKSVGNLAFRWK